MSFYGMVLFFVWKGSEKAMSKSTCSGYTHTQEQCDYHANQMNPNSDVYAAAMDNHANQCNPNNDNYQGK